MTSLALHLLFVVTRGHVSTATFNEKLWANNTATDYATEAAQWSDVKIREEFAAWQRAHDEV